MGRYRTVECGLFDKEWFQDLEPDAKLVFLFLFQNSTTSACGATTLTVKAIHAYLGIDRERIAAIIAALDPRVVWAKGYGIIWIRGFYRHQASNPNFAKSAIRAAKDLPSELEKLFIAEYPELYPNAIRGSMEGYGNPIGTLSEPLGNGIDTLSNLREQRTENREEPPYPLEGEAASAADGGEGANENDEEEDPAAKYPADFEVFLDAYQNAAGKKTRSEVGPKEPAFKKWKRLNLTDKRDALNRLPNVAASDTWRSGYPPYARTYLGDRIWDDYAEIPPGSTDNADGPSLLSKYFAITADGKIIGAKAQ